MDNFDDDVSVLIAGIALSTKMIDAHRRAIKELEQGRDEDRQELIELMQSQGVLSLDSSGFTVSIKKLPIRAQVIDESLIPDEYMIKKPDMKSLNAAAKSCSIPGVTLSNGGYTVALKAND